MKEAAPERPSVITSSSGHGSSDFRELSPSTKALNYLSPDKKRRSHGGLMTEPLTIGTKKLNEIAILASSEQENEDPRSSYQVSIHLHLPCIYKITVGRPRPNHLYFKFAESRRVDSCYNS